MDLTPVAANSVDAGYEEVWLVNDMCVLHVHELYVMWQCVISICVVAVQSMLPSVPQQ